MFPPEVLSNILSYVDDIGLQSSCRLVNSQWYNIVNQQGCVCFQFSKSMRIEEEAQHGNYYEMCLQGYHVPTEEFTKQVLVEMKANMNDKEQVRKSWLNRTKGHLPEPMMPPFRREGFMGVPYSKNFHIQPVNAKLRSSSPFSASVQEPARVTAPSHVFFIMRFNVNKWTPLAIDLSSSVVIRGEYMVSDQSVYRNLSTDSSRPMKYTLQEINLTGLAHLQHLSARGMSALRKIYLPSSIMALDASNCTRLQAIHIPLMGEGDHKETQPALNLVSLNVNGCRSLRYLLGPTCSIKQAVSNLEQLDLSSTLALAKPVIATALQSTTCLQSVSLRYIGTDDILMGLASSLSTQNTLTLVDVAFSSTELTDNSVYNLVEKARKLERLNLRGCRGVTSECYNNTPIVLLQRHQSQVRGANNSGVAAVAHGNRKRGKDSVGSEADYSLLGNVANRCPSANSLKKRKGDNVFLFCPFY